MLCICQLFFHPLFQCFSLLLIFCYYYFTLVYLIGFHGLYFGVTVAHVCVALFYFVYASVGAGPGGWVDLILLTTRVLPSYRAGVAWWANCRVVLGM